MENVENPLIYTFTFNTPGYNTKHLTVTTPHYAMICKFINMHFDQDAMDCIIAKPFDELPDEIVENLDHTDLQYYVIGDNSSKTKYTIPASLELLEIIGTVICAELSTVEVFGDAITRTEQLPIMKALCELIEELELGNVLDAELKNIDEANAYVIYNKINRFEFPDDDGKFEDDDSYDDSVIYSQMRSGIMSIKNKEPLPFTIRGYVSAFSSLLVNP
jgi:hypothetical protein